MVRASYDTEDGIDPILFGTNVTGGMFIVSGDKEIPFGPKRMHSNVERIKLKKEIDRTQKDLEPSFTIKDGKNHIVIIKENGEENIMVNGQKVTREEYNEIEKENVDKEIIIKRMPQGEGNDNIWIETSGNTSHKIIIREIDGQETIEVNGKKISPEEFEKIEVEADQMRLDLNRQKNNTKMKSVFIIKEGDEEMVEENEEQLIHSSVKNTADFEDIQIIIDGKVSTRAEMDKLSPDEIASVNILKDAKDEKNTGRKNKTAVIKIKTKKNKN